VSSFGNRLAISISRQDESEAGTYDDKGPWEIDVPNMQMVAEEDEHSRDDDGGDKLGKSEEVESERRIVGRLLGEPVSCHCKSALKRVTAEFNYCTSNGMQWNASSEEQLKICEGGAGKRMDDIGRSAVEGFALIAPGVEMPSAACYDASKYFELLLVSHPRVSNARPAAREWYALAALPYFAPENGKPSVRGRVYGLQRSHHVVD
jgi:hypothetical protein